MAPLAGRGVVHHAHHFGLGYLYRVCAADRLEDQALKTDERQAPICGACLSLFRLPWSLRDDVDHLAWYNDDLRHLLTLNMAHHVGLFQCGLFYILTRGIRGHGDPPT